jgi:L-2-hydroxycarboxylate dehydrogenase (NAD+)
MGSRNGFPEAGIRIPADEMRAFIADIFLQVGMRPERASELADYLARSDLRCVFSHGTSQAIGYARLMRDGKVNPDPTLRVIEDAPSVTTVDGDGGMGYFACYEAMQITIRKAKETGTAAATTMNHYHFGAAGTWSRLALEHDCIGMAISSHRFYPNPEHTLSVAVSGGPLSIAVPAGEQPPFVFDAGHIEQVYSDEIFLESPQRFYKAFGINAAVTILGGLLAGIYKPELQSTPWEPNQGAFLSVFDISRFMPVKEFRAEMDRYVGDVRNMKPLPGTDTAMLPGGHEYVWEEENARLGIPVGDEHRERLEETAKEFGISSPFGRYEHSRFDSSASSS